MIFFCTTVGSGNIICVRRGLVDVSLGRFRIALGRLPAPTRFALGCYLDRLLDQYLVGYVGYLAVLRIPYLRVRIGFSGKSSS